MSFRTNVNGATVLASLTAGVREFSNENGCFILILGRILVRPSIRRNSLHIHYTLICMPLYFCMYLSCLPCIHILYNMGTHYIEGISVDLVFD